MSKAFTKDDDAAPPPLLPRRAPLPAGQPNYVTPRGLAALRAELSALRVEQAGSRSEGAPDASILERLAELEDRLGSAELVEPPKPPPAEARFGATVTVRTEAGTERAYAIVGVDEADAGAGRIAFVAPLARALLGKRPGDVTTVRTPHATTSSRWFASRTRQYDGPVVVMRIVTLALGLFSAACGGEPVCHEAVTEVPWHARSWGTAPINDIWWVSGRATNGRRRSVRRARMAAWRASTGRARSGRPR